MSEEITFTIRKPKPGDQLPFTVLEHNGEILGYDDTGDLCFGDGPVYESDASWFNLLGLKLSIPVANIVAAEPADEVSKDA